VVSRCTVAANKLTQAMKKARFDEWEHVDIEEEGEEAPGDDTDDDGGGFFGGARPLSYW
jgi:hypothetical protein